MAEEKLNQEQLDEILSLLSLGPLMSQRALDAVRHLNPTTVKTIGAALKGARDRSEALREQSDNIKGRLQHGLDDGRTEPIRTLQQARSKIARAKPADTNQEQSHAPAEIPFPVFDRASFWLMSIHIGSRERVQLQWVAQDQEPTQQPITMTESSQVLACVEAEMIIDA